MTTALGIAYLGLVGAALGSFLNVCIYRWPAGLSVLRPRSRCPVCETPIAWYDNIPVLSWVALQGRCRHCDASISGQYPLIELVVAGIWVGLALWHGPGLEAVRGAIFLTALLGIAIIDGRHHIIPDQLSLGGALVGLAIAAWPAGFDLATAVAGAVLGYALMWGVKLGGEALLKKPALGVGDIHMMAMIGAFTGTWGAVLSVLLGSVLGLAIGVPLAASRGELQARGTYLPLGTFLAMGATIAYLWGDVIIDWYLNFVLT